MPLAPIREAVLVPGAVAGVLGIPEQAGRDPTVLLCDAIGSRTLLLVIDNCEHLLDASARLADALLDLCPNVRILATSREALGVEGEQSWPTPSLGIPDTLDATFDDIVEANAVELFVERARAARPEFTLTAENAGDVAALCSRLDGIPLAIELAAARVSALTPRDILDRIDQRFLLLTGGSRTALERHQTLQAAVAWSYDLLDERERRLFDRLSVFAGGFTLAAAHAVAADPNDEEIDVLDVLAALVNKSMVIADGAGTSARFRLLETLRQYGRDRLAETPDVQAVRDRHARYYVALYEAFEPGPDDVVTWHARRLEVDNVRTAFDWCAEQGDATAALRVIGSVGWAWFDAADGFRRGERALELASGLAPADRAAPFAWTAYFAFNAGDQARAAELAEASIACALEAGIEPPWPASTTIGLVAFWHNDSERAIDAFEHSIAAHRRAHDDSPESRSRLVFDLGLLCFGFGQSGNTEHAITVGEEAVDLARRLGSPGALGAALNQLGLACQSTDRERALRLLEESLQYDLGFSGVRRSWDLLFYAQVQLANQDHTGGLSTLYECLAAARQVANRNILPPALLAMARAFRRLDQSDVAARLLGASVGQLEQSGVPGGPADTRARERVEQTLRETLGDAHFEAELEAGRALTRDDALVFALNATRQANPTDNHPNTKT